jgi:hypothetical protein
MERFTFLPRSPKTMLLQERDEVVSNAIPYARYIAIQEYVKHLPDETKAQASYESTFCRILESVEQQFWNAAK